MLWAASAGALALGFVSLPFLLPAAAILLALASRYARRLSDMLGVVVGVGALLVVIGALHLNDHPCSPSRVIVVPPGRSDAGCGGFSGLPWLAVGLVLLMLGLATHLHTRRAWPAHSIKRRRER